jgi:hypothetical protein
VDLQDLTLQIALPLAHDEHGGMTVPSRAYARLLDFLAEEPTDFAYSLCFHETQTDASTIYTPEGFDAGAQRASTLTFCHDARVRLSSVLIVEVDNALKQFSEGDGSGSRLLGRDHCTSEWPITMNLQSRAAAASHSGRATHGDVNDGDTGDAKVHVGRVYKIAVAFKILQRSNDMVLYQGASHYFTLIRNSVDVLYLVQHETFCNASRLRHRNAEVLVVQWREELECRGNCIFLPNSTQNEGRNAMWYKSFEKWPGTVFKYYVFMDGDASLSFRANRTSLHVPLDVPAALLPFRMFESLLLHHKPAVGVPFHTTWHDDDGSDVQLLSNYDHIVLAIHQNVSRLFLPTETRWDNHSWWWAQRLHGFLAAAAFHTQTMQLNAIVSENGSRDQQRVQPPGSTAVCLDARLSALDSSADARALGNSTQICTHLRALVEPFSSCARNCPFLLTRNMFPQSNAFSQCFR